MKNNRREFIKQTSIYAGGLALSTLLPSFTLEADKKKKFDFKISLAQWSLHKALFSKEITTLDFPEIAKNQYGIEVVEYVNQFFPDKAKDMEYLKDLKKRCDDHGVKSHLIMVDNEGSLAATDAKERLTAVENHYKWVDAAKFLGCSSIRVNLHGHGTEQEWKEASIDGLSKLVAYGTKQQMNIIVENHGQWSSKGNLVAEVMKTINSKYCGTLPDFGNFCVRRRDGDLWESPCVETYDMYKGVQEMLPYAKGISAKAFNFDKNGNESNIDFIKMFTMAKDAGFNGYVGIEYEGNNLPEKEGIVTTKKLLEKVRAQLA